MEMLQPGALSKHNITWCNLEKKNKKHIYNKPNAAYIRRDGRRILNGLGGGERGKWLDDSGKLWVFPRV